MPLYLTKNNSEGSQIAIWQMTESVAELLRLSVSSEKIQSPPKDGLAWESEAENFRSEMRKKEWLTLRLLLKDVLKIAHRDEIVYDEKGKPHLKNGSGHISFSHTGNFAAIIFHPEKNVGIDIESVHERIEKIARKFANAEEISFIKTEKRVETLHIIWGVKEVLFKIHGKGGLDFKKHLFVHPFAPMNEGIVEAEMKIENSVSLLNINYFFKDGLVVVYGCQ